MELFGQDDTRGRRPVGEGAAPRAPITARGSIDLFDRPKGRDVPHGLVMDMYEQFVVFVATGHHIDSDKVHALADGSAGTMIARGR
jgi:hypothetical protein